jgi:ferric-dicitrate binding protein FerR (iron transport regulator)
MTTERLHGLIDDWRDGMLSEETAAEFSQLLRESDEARRTFRAEAQMHGLLHQAVMEKVVEEASRQGTFRQGIRVAPRKRLLAAAAALLLIGVTAIWLQIGSQKQKSLNCFATLVHSADCVWEGSTHPQTGNRLAEEGLSLREGMAELKLDNGVHILIEAPTRMALVDTENSLLHAGRIVVRVPPTAVGYAVNTPNARVVDLGTEFGVSVEPDRETVVQVFDGAVVAEMKHAAASDKRNYRIEAGETVHIDVSETIELQKVTFSPERFMRTFSTPSVHEGDELIPFTPSHVSSLDVSASPGGAIVDGDLSDWDRSNWFEARCTGSFSASHYVHGGLAYDEQYLYIAARVGDPMPMRNVIDPNTDQWSAWIGGSLQFRLSTDRTFGWPVDARMPYPRREASPKDTSDRIIHLTMWYFQPREEPCLEIRYGMNLDRGVVNPVGWQGAFRKAPDGQSYTVECAVPWTLLGAGDDPPRSGDELGFCWTVNWSDASGKRWKGQLVEIKNPDYATRGKTLTFMSAETWGKAVYR